MFNKSIIYLQQVQGTRMKSDTPKVLQRFLEKPMLYYSIKEALKLSDDITVVLFHQFEKVKRKKKYFSNINFCYSRPCYPGTGGGSYGNSSKIWKSFSFKWRYALFKQVN